MPARSFAHSLQTFSNATRIDPLNWIALVRQGLVQIATADFPGGETEF